MIARLCTVAYYTYEDNRVSTTAYTVELHLSGLIGTAGRPDKQKIWIIGFFF